ncbi:hypothetical protein MBLNU457_6127t1 [Dothideomycetes sp. NU457]
MPHRRSGSVIGNYRDDPNSMALNEMSDSLGPIFSPTGKKRKSMKSHIMEITSSVFDQSHGRRKTMLVYIFVVVLLGCSIFLLHGETPKRLKISSLNHITNHFKSQDVSKHPIEMLVAQHELEFQDMVKRQSKTLDQAVKEYRRRYHRRPPPGFAKWFEIAQQRNFVLIDEWDTLMESLEPYWGVHPKTLVARLQSRLTLGGCQEMSFKESGITTSLDGVATRPESWIIDTFTEMMSDMPWREMVSNVTVVVNTMDEPSVSVPNAVLKEALSAASKQKSTLDGPSAEIEEGDEEIYIHNFSKENSWEFLLSSCPAHEESSTADTDKEVLPFISDLKKARDPCLNPFLPPHHGIWLSPANLLLTKHLVPVLSNAKPEHFNDVPHPEPFYYRILNEDWDDEDKDFADREDRVYWVGTGNGGMSNHANWRQLQRQRMAILAGPDNHESVSLLKKTKTTNSGRSQWIPREGRTWSDMASYFHIKIGMTEVCSDSCEEQEAYFKPVRESPAEVFGSKYCLDIDGMGFSGRYLRLLRSNCAVMKQSIFVEWLDGWLVPWVHFIPVTLEASELPEITRFLIEEEEGQAVGEKIALQGREWSRKVLRREDMELYFVRLLMEMERILSPERNDMYYEG